VSDAVNDAWRYMANESCTCVLRGRPAGRKAGADVEDMTDKVAAAGRIHHRLMTTQSSTADSIHR